VSRILVADDNSNIQKMVALALKDEGIDVVAVGNGEAAMRKIPDLRPDLVLADIFMPVRNGYELCEFIKNDSRYMNTPVVLLVGAFDPLDEQETQRVRADGVLKKPFVPPDPLINMVKALLAKSNGQKSAPVQTPIPPKPAAPPAATQASSMLETQVASAGPLPLPQAEVSSAQQKPAVPVPPPFIPPVPSPRPQAAKVEDPDEVTTSTRDPNLGDPFWATPAQHEVVEEGKAETQPEDIIDMHSFGKGEESAEEEDDERPAFRPDSSLLDTVGLDADFSQTIVNQKEPVTPQQVKEAEKEELGAVLPAPEPPVSSAPPPEAAAEIFKFDPTLTFALPTQDAAPDETSAEADKASVIQPEIAAAPVNDHAAASSWPDLTDALPVAPEKPLDSHQAKTYEELDPVLELPALPNHEAVITAATEAARLAFAELNTLPASGASAGTSDRHASLTEHKDSFSAPAQADAPAAATPEMIDAVVNRLLEHMQPQIMEVVNREVLRPAIEAIVRREMKKS
jgi:CheY-like chemotaxis protein